MESINNYDSFKDYFKAVNKAINEREENTDDPVPNLNTEEKADILNKIYLELEKMSIQEIDEFGFYLHTELLGKDDERQDYPFTIDDVKDIIDFLGPKNYNKIYELLLPVEVTDDFDVDLYDCDVVDYSGFVDADDVPDFSSEISEAFRKSTFTEILCESSKILSNHNVNSNTKTFDLAKKIFESKNIRKYKFMCEKHEPKFESDIVISECYHALMEAANSNNDIEIAMNEAIENADDVIEINDEVNDIELSRSINDTFNRFLNDTNIDGLSEDEVERKFLQYIDENLLNENPKAYITAQSKAAHKKVRNFFGTRYSKMKKMKVINRIKRRASGQARKAKKYYKRFKIKLLKKAKQLNKLKKAGLWKSKTHRGKPV